jgi:hypothetical protein
MGKKDSHWSWFQMGEAGKPYNLAEHHRALKLPLTLLDVYRGASSKTIHKALWVTAISWAPAAALAASDGLATFESFLQDYAAQSRALIVIPLLILGLPPLMKRLEAIAVHFLENDIVSWDDRPRFEAALDRFRHASSSGFSVVLILVLVYLLFFSAMAFVQPGTLRPWCYSAPGSGRLSPAGWWYALVTLPITASLVLAWMWRQVVWAWFLKTISRMDLRFVPAHPDQTAGIGFVEYCLRAYMPFAFAVGAMVVGGVANRVLHLNMPLSGFRSIIPVLVGFVLVVCVAPLCVWFQSLIQTQRRGIFQYGALATDVGREFEKRWLQHRGRVDEGALEMQDFSATTDLYSIVDNVHRMKPVPIGLRSLVRLALVTLSPVIPLMLAALPFNVVMDWVMKRFA